MALLKKQFRLAVVLIPLLIIFFLPVAFGQEEELVLDNPDVFGEEQRPAVVFPHELHMGEFDCLECHHDYNAEGKNVLDEDSLEEGNEDLKCAACHDAGTDVGLRQAFHRLCMGCHRDFRKAGEATGPELCGECHIK